MVVIDISPKLSNFNNDVDIKLSYSPEDLSFINKSITFKLDVTYSIYITDYIRYCVQERRNSFID